MQNQQLIKKMTGLENTLFKELGFNCIGKNIHSPFQIKMKKGQNFRYEANKVEENIEDSDNKNICLFENCKG